MQTNFESNRSIGSDESTEVVTSTGTNTINYQYGVDKKTKQEHVNRHRARTSSGKGKPFNNRIAYSYGGR